MWKIVHLQFYKEAKQKININGKPVILGPITFVKLSKGYKENDVHRVVEKFVPLYAEILRELQEEGVEWVQIDEPILADNDFKRRRLHYLKMSINIASSSPEYKAHSTNLF